MIMFLSCDSLVLVKTDIKNNYYYIQELTSTNLITDKKSSIIMLHISIIILSELVFVNHDSSSAPRSPNKKILTTKNKC